MSDTITVNFEELPKEILKRIPYSLRSFKNIWTQDELPYDIFHMIEDYLQRNPTIQYSRVYDIKPQISEYGDFLTITQKKDIVFDYLTTYFQISINGYPFDPTFYSPLKLYIQRKDTSTVKQLITAELQNACNLITRDLSFKVRLKDSSILPEAMKNGGMSYSLILLLSVDNEEITLTIVMTQ